jgi:hypothetical protein
MELRDALPGPDSLKPVLCSGGQRLGHQLMAGRDGSIAHDLAAFRHLGLTVGTLLLLWVFVMTAHPVHSQGLQADEDLPVLYGLKLEDSRVSLDVISFGCTDASYFSVQLEPAAPDSYRLSILRRRRDRCRVAAHIITVTLEVPAVPNPAQARFILVNRLAVPGPLQRADP